jgi:RNA-directed DNA polymerase
MLKHSSNPRKNLNCSKYASNKKKQYRKMKNITWQNINWKTIETRVFKLQKQIFQCRRDGDCLKMQALQRIMIKLPEAKMLAVRRVTQDNRGKNTPGADGIKNLTPQKRLELVRELKLDGTADPIRRVHIPKPSQPNEMRPLGIPTIKDRAKQALAHMALEPEWEAVFEANSYGFRPGRSCHDAIEAIHLSINKKAKYVLDADIAKCFDRINHEALLSKINTFPVMERQIRAWLKSKILDGNETLFPKEGTPQGGVISPLLSNIALHGMEEHIKEWIATIPYRGKNGKVMSIKDRKAQLSLIRYADDLVVIHPELHVIQEAEKKLTEWLKPMGLELKSSKTKIVHTFESQTCEVGFNFLGFHIRQYRVSKYQAGKLSLPFKTFTKPSEEALKRHFLEVKKVLKASTKIEGIVTRLNMIIRGWAYYYRTAASRHTFSKCDKLIMEKLMKWAQRKHPSKPSTWVYSKYLKRVQNRMRFGYEAEQHYYIKLYTDVAIKRHTKVSGSRSPYDGDWSYWVPRGQKFFGHVPKVQHLMLQQKGKCARCGLYFTSTDVTEIDHVIPKGGDRWQNLQLIHGHCHDQKTAEDLTAKRQDMQGAV